MRQVNILLYLIGFVVLFLSCSDKNNLPTEVIGPIAESDSSTYDDSDYNFPYQDSIVARTYNAIVIMYKDGSGLRKIKDNIVASFVSWSPSKRKILFSDYHGLYSFNIDNHNEDKISIQNERFEYAMYSPNEEKIAYISIDTTDQYLSRGYIKVMNSDGSNVQVLTPIQPIPNRVSWMPDSKRIIFNGEDSLSRGIFSVSIKNFQILNLFRDNIGLCSQPSVSRDGKTIAFSYSFGDGNGGKIMLLDTKDNTTTQLTFGNSSDDNPSWSYDRKSIVYGRGESLRPYSWVGPYIWIIDIDGSNNNLLTTTDDGAYGPCLQQ